MGLASHLGLKTSRMKPAAGSFGKFLLVGIPSVVSKAVEVFSLGRSFRVDV
jgi:hypothetical protein